MKKMQLFGMILMIISILFIPNNINAKEEKVMCKYMYQDKELVYTINSKVDVPFTDGENNFYHADNFKEDYLRSAKTNSINYVCPTITIEESSLFTTIFVNAKNDEDCNGKCTKVSTKNYSSKENISVKKAVDTTAIGSVGIYNENKYFIPMFRLLNDGTKEWSINGKDFVETNESIQINNIEIKLDSKLINKIYANNKVNDVTIYRNVKVDENQYKYLLSTKKVKGYDLIDGQEIASNSYHKALGEPEMDEWLEDYNQNQDCTGDNSILGSYDDPESVAYFLQIIFNWVKLIGPFIVVVMSGIEFAKVVVMGDDDGMKKAQNKLIIRLILAASLFILPDIVSAFLELFNITSSGICGLQ
ncbi:MAG: hypothetical protein IJA30_06325 [Bacilli bacterium]|nr:hypothetical protein [Bacilli bacterium]